MSMVDLDVAVAMQKERKSSERVQPLILSGGHATQIDFLLTRRHHISKVTNCKVIPGMSLSPQHRLLVMHLCVKPKTKRFEHTKCQIRWWLLDEDKYQELFSAIGDKYAVQREIKAKKVLFKKWQASRTPEDLDAYRSAKRTAKRAVARAICDHLQPLCDKLESSEGQKLIYKLARSRVKAALDITKCRCVKDLRGNLLCEDLEVKERRRSYFHELNMQHKEKPIGILTTTVGKPVDIRETITLNSEELISNEYLLDHMLHFDGERVPERVVHAKATGAFGYFEVTHDVSKYTKADVFNGIGKKTPVAVRFSTGLASKGGNDVSRELKGFSIKFYTNEGNLDLLGLNIPVYFYPDSIMFSTLIHAFKKNPRTNLFDETSRWDLMTLRPIIMHGLFWIFSDYGIPNGYRKMDGFPIHAYELSNKRGDRYYAKFNFRTEQGFENLTTVEAAAITAQDLDYSTRDLYNNIALKNYPSWRLDLDIMSFDDIKNLDYNPFDVTRMWKNGTFHTVQVGRLVLDRNVDNFFKTVELSAYNPGSLVPGINTPPDALFKGRRLFYRDTQNFRIGRNHHNIEVNSPKYVKTYNRDGVPPVRHNMKDAPNYYPNSFHGPVPVVDGSRPKDRLVVLESNAVDLQPHSEFYNIILTDEGQKQRFIDNIVLSLVPVVPSIQEKALKIITLIDLELSKRVRAGLEAASATT
ncbi:catalase-like [Aphomia sociella]